jgi:hypothetical protein
LTIAVIALGVVAVLLLADRWQQRRHPDATAVELIAVIDRLCQRVQAPAAAILEHDEAVRSPRSEEYAPPAVAPEDDEGYWESRDKLAELMMAEELSGRS